jgi:hypothetical protein
LAVWDSAQSCGLRDGLNRALEIGRIGEIDDLKRIGTVETTT